MDYTDKTREELIKELQDLQQEFDSMKELFEKDITGRKQTEAQREAALGALRRAEDNFRRTLDDSPFGVRIVTAEGEIIYTNRAILDIYGYDSIEEIRTTSIKNRYTPESYAEFQIRYDKRRQGEESPSEYEISIVKKNGEV
ncbi:MAG: PAS domain-containing protein, partial [Bacteroidales bacterium]